MKSSRLTRRQFFKASALGAGALALPAIGLASIAASPSREARAAAEQPDGPSIPQPTFNPIASNTTFGALTDISMGWDGTLWGIDAQGAPHVYDSINNLWAPHGQGIDAALGSLDVGGTAYVFQGSQVTRINGATMQAEAPQAIGSLWPSLPESFKLGVVGASWGPLQNSLILYNGGRFVATDGSIPPTNLTDLPGWPQASQWPNWKDGIIDGVITINTGLTEAYLIRKGEILYIDPVNKTVFGNPIPLQLDWWGDPNVLPASWVTSVNAGTRIQTAAGTVDWFFSGVSVAPLTTFSNSGQITYIANLASNWPATWHPVLAHAPNGRDGNLWSVLPQAQGSWIVQHNGEAWTQLPNQADHAGVGQDNAVMIASAGRLWTVAANAGNTGYDVTPVSAPNNLIQVSLGNANAVYARDSANNVYSFNLATQALTQNANISANGGARHIATTNDGTVWHAKPNDANMHRFLSSANVVQSGIPVKQGIVSAVSKVAATGFGAAHCLAQDGQGNAQAYRYDSPYVFKTSGAYTASSTVVAQGLGMLYITDEQTDILQGTQVTWIVAIDAHTGQEISRSAPLATPQTTYSTPAFDPVNELVYVGTQKGYEPGDPYDRTTPGRLLALDARDLTKVAWSFTAAASVDAAPVVSGGMLLFGDRTGALYAFNTQAALTNPAQPTPAWVWQIGNGIDSSVTYRVAAPLVTAGQVKAAVWNTGMWTNPTYSLWSAACNVADGTGQTLKYLHAPTASGLSENESLLTSPVLVRKAFADLSQAPIDYVFFNGGDAIVSVDPAKGPTRFNLPSGAVVNAGLTYDPDTEVVWFVTNGAALYGVDASLNVVSHTPYALISNNPYAAVFASPIAYTDAKGNTTVVVGMYDESAQAGGLYGFDPSSGNASYLPTGATQILSLSAGVSNGVIYAAGSDEDPVSQATFGQVWGIRIDALTQGQRDFIIESQLMQDPDPSLGKTTVTAPDGNVIPPSKARYQTHLTVVDDAKVPLPHEPVKIWAEIAGTVIAVNGAQYTIGPDDASFAAVKTGVDGSLVIVSDATDINASALRVWASFMDPYERILVYPDHEWHGRSTNSYSDATADPTKAPDPTKPNLNTVYSYKADASDPNGTTPKPLFTDAEKTQGTPANIAKAISQMKSGLNPGGNQPATAAGALKTLHGSNPIAPYIAYTDLGGMHYGPNNARAKRSATVVAPFGFALNKAQGGTHTYTPLSHSDARNQIDALTGDAWDPNNPNAPLSAGAGAPPPRFVVRRADDFFTDFWNWLVGAVNTVVQTVENIVVSVANDIMVGINFIINGVTKVFKAVIQVIEDVVNAIGSFFVQLAKLIEEVIEALSLLFHFGEIMWTHRWLAGQVNQRVTDLTNAISQTIIGNIDTFFKEGEQAIEGFFDTLKAEFSTGGNPQLGNARGYGQTPHTAFTITPRGGAPSSQATQCTWGTQKAQSGTPGANVTSPVAPGAAVTDPVSAFFDGFIARLSSDPVLSADLAQLKSDFGNLVQVNSPAQFFSQLMTALLDLIKTLMVSALSIANALIDGLANIIQDVINVVLSILNAEIEIPVLTWLYETLFGEKLTLLNIVTLVSAIPITLIFRLVENQYPSQAGLPAYPTALNARASGQRPNRADVAPKPALIAFGIFVAICQLVQGVANCIGDGFDDVPAAGYVSLVSGVLAEIFSFPTISNEPGDVSAWDWAVYGIGVFGVLFTVAGLSYTRTDGTPNEPASTEFMSYGSLFISLGLFAVAITAYVKDGKTDGISNAEFAETIIEAIVGAINPLKLDGGEAMAVVAVFDALGGVIELFMTLFTSIISAGSPAPLRRHYFPFVAFAPQPR